MKLRAPEGCHSVSHGGCILTVEADGSVDVDEPIAEILATHGFLPWPEMKPDFSEAYDESSSLGASIKAEENADMDLVSLNRPALFALLRRRGIRVALPITNEELRTAARRSSQT